MPGPEVGRTLVAAAALILIAGLAASYFTIARYERGVVTRAGRLLYIAEPGLHFKIPFLDSVRVCRLDLQQFTTPPLNTYTVDNQEVDATLTVQWQLSVEQLAFTFTNTPA